jgi:hypothetical protein
VLADPAALAVALSRGRQVLQHAFASAVVLTAIGIFLM